MTAFSVVEVHHGQGITVFLVDVVIAREALVRHEHQVATVGSHLRRAMPNTRLTHTRPTVPEHSDFINVFERKSRDERGYATMRHIQVRLTRGSTRGKIAR